MNASSPKIAQHMVAAIAAKPFPKRRVGRPLKMPEGQLCRRKVVRVTAVLDAAIEVHRRSLVRRKGDNVNEDDAIRDLLEIGARDQGLLPKNAKKP